MHVGRPTYGVCLSNGMFSYVLFARVGLHLHDKWQSGMILQECRPLRVIGLLDPPKDAKQFSKYPHQLLANKDQSYSEDVFSTIRCTSRLYGNIQPERLSIRYRSHNRSQLWRLSRMLEKFGSFARCPFCRSSEWNCHNILNPSETMSHIYLGYHTIPRPHRRGYRERITA